MVELSRITVQWGQNYSERVLTLIDMRSDTFISLFILDQILSVKRAIFQMFW